MPNPGTFSVPSLRAKLKKKEFLPEKPRSYQYQMRWVLRVACG